MVPQVYMFVCSCESAALAEKVLCAVEAVGLTAASAFTVGMLVLAEIEDGPVDGVFDPFMPSLICRIVVCFLGPGVIADSLCCNRAFSLLNAAR
jgi:hypothetical protein